MPDLTIRTYPSGVLRKKCSLVKGVGSEEKMLLSDMTRVMYSSNGIGLAASQVGITKSIAVVDAGTGLIKMANPMIVSGKGSSSMEEGCLSVPDNYVNVKRAAEIAVSYLDENDKECKKTFCGLVARVIQHEIDHLNGKLIIDYVSWYGRLRKKRQYSDVTGRKTGKRI